MIRFCIKCGAAGIASVSRIHDTDHYACGTQVRWSHDGKEITDTLESKKCLQNQLEKVTKAARVYELLNRIRQDEGTQINIINSNADFGGPNEQVEVSYDFSHDYRTYTGETLVECLEKAWKDRESEV